MPSFAPILFKFLYRCLIFLSSFSLLFSWINIYFHCSMLVTSFLERYVILTLKLLSRLIRFSTFWIIISCLSPTPLSLSLSLSHTHTHTHTHLWQGVNRYLEIAYLDPWQFYFLSCCLQYSCRYCAKKLLP